MVWMLWRNLYKYHKNRFRWNFKWIFAILSISQFDGFSVAHDENILIMIQLTRCTLSFDNNIYLLRSLAFAQTYLKRAHTHLHQLICTKSVECKKIKSINIARKKNQITLLCDHVSVSESVYARKIIHFKCQNVCLFAYKYYWMEFWTRAGYFVTTNKFSNFMYLTAMHNIFCCWFCWIFYSHSNSKRKM